jgi:Flp pilus assembly protein TadD
MNPLVQWLGHRWLGTQASIALIFGRSATARDLYEQMAHRFPRDTAALMSLGSLRMEAGDSGGAAQALGELLRRDPGDANAWFNLGFVHEKRDELADCERCMREAVRINPRHDRAWYGLAMALIRDNRLEQAVAALEQNIALQPMSPYGYYQLGMTHHHLGQPKRARRMVTRLREFEPKYAATLERDIERTEPRMAGLGAAPDSGDASPPQGPVPALAGTA